LWFQYDPFPLWLFLLLDNKKTAHLTVNATKLRKDWVSAEMRDPVFCNYFQNIT